MVKLLLVDDEANCRTVTRAILLDDFPEIIIDEAVDGKEACAYIAQSLPDIVLMDIQMPRMDGVTATKQMRSMGYKGHIILRSASATLVERLKGQDIGATAILDKGGDGMSYALNRFLEGYLRPK